MEKIKIDLVIVTYNPNLELLSNLIKSIQSQVRNIYIIDNTESKHICLNNIENIEIIQLNVNMGIAYAQNIGLKKALDNKADYIMLSDQDTTYPDNYVYDMLKALNYSDNIAAVVPLFKDINQNKNNDGFIVKNKKFGTKKIYPVKGYFEVFQAIASGKIIVSKYLNYIGLMDEFLFIDYVDLEWCWRAQKNNFKIIGNADVTITHKLGDDIVSIGNKEITLRSPIRHYYMVRNSLYLSLTCKSLDFTRRLFLFFRSFYLMIGFSILSKPHLVHFKYTFQGIIDGLNKKIGKYQGNIND